MRWQETTDADWAVDAKHKRDACREHEYCEAENAIHRRGSGLAEHFPSAKMLFGNEYVANQ